MNLDGVERMARDDGGDAGEQTGNVLLVARALRHPLPALLETSRLLSQNHRPFSLPQASKLGRIGGAAAERDGETE